ncbi:MAG: alpha/beta hydrolase [Candidatus Paceibacterota bacterium]|jgi:pimeloyl-ACP methyl ester carboxylesterase
MTVNFKTIKINHVEIFYRESGDLDKPVILLLHGFPSTSFMFRDLINDLSEKYRVIAPDYPGFGQSSSLSPNEFNYTFENLTNYIEQFIDALGLKKLSLYMHAYGGPIGLRIAKKRPELIQSLIIQNANTYLEGIGEALNPLVAYVQNQTPETEKGARGFLDYGATLWQYYHGVKDTTKVSPDSVVIDQYYLTRPVNDEIQLALFRDYGANLEKYEEWQEYFQKKQPPTLILWGKNDELFIPQGAKAYRQHLPEAKIYFINSGHFILEEYHEYAAQLIDKFLTNLIGEI